MYVILCRITVINPGTIANELTKLSGDGVITVEHPSGGIDVDLSHTTERPEDIRASVIRTARKILSGTVYIPE